MYKLLFPPQFMRFCLDNPPWIVSAKKTNKTNNNDNKNGENKLQRKNNVLHIQYIQTCSQTHIYSWFSRSKAVWLLVVVGRLWSNFFRLCKNSSLRESNDCHHNRGLNNFSFITIFFFLLGSHWDNRTVTYPKHQKKTQKLQLVASSSSVAQKDLDNWDNECIVWRIALTIHIRNGGAASKCDNWQLSFQTNKQNWFNRKKLTCKKLSFESLIMVQ